LLSQRYISEEYSDRIVGEVLNNGSDTAELVQINASFYDGNGIFLGSVMNYTDPSTIEPGNRAPFTAFITSDTIEDNTETYEFTIQWRDINGNDKSVKVTGDLAQSNTADNVDSNNTINSVGDSGNNPTLGEGETGEGNGNGGEEGGGEEGGN
jgi:hypothetical protein